MQLLAAVGSTNPVKLQAAAAALARMFPGRPVRIHSVAAASGVPDQPWGEEETRGGALNRARAALAAAPDCILGIGQEGGLVESPAGLLACAWFAVTDGRVTGEGRSASFLLPAALAERVRAGQELGHAADALFDRHNCKQDEGAIGLLSGGVLGRQELYVQGLIMALLPFRPGGAYSMEDPDESHTDPASLRQPRPGIRIRNTEAPMDESRIAGRKPIVLSLSKGQAVAWCSCGHSTNQPWCDGSHRGSSFRPLVFTPEADGPAALCACKRSQGSPFCDGSHKHLPADDPA
jgi:inosine/xanthosine triphosphatase